jgi:hypothetical protein
MTAAGGIRRDRRAFSAFYGAFAVILAATVVFGAIAANTVPAGDHADAGADEATAQAFLAALLASTEPVSNLSLGEALSRLCMDAACTGAPTPRSAVDWAGGLARNLSRGLAVDYLLVLRAGDLPELRSGTLAPRPGLPLARAEVYHPGLDGFVAAVLFLGAN